MILDVDEQGLEHKTGYGARGDGKDFGEDRLLHSNGKL